MRVLACLLASIVASIGPGCAEEDCDADGVCHDEDGLLFEAAFEEAQQPGKDDGTDCSGVRVPDRRGFGKRIALTFDDGPSPATTPQIMEILRAHNAPAAFFVNGSRIKNPATREIAAQIAADPLFVLANHSHSHLNLATQTPAKVTEQIMLTDGLIRAAGETPKFFRFPFGSSTCETMAEVRGRGYTSVGWHVDSADWCYAAGKGVCPAETFRYVPDDMRADMAAYVLSQVRTFDGGILLFHDIHPSTAAALDGLLTQLEDEGFQFVALTNHAAFPKLNGAVAAPTRFIGDACTSDADCGFSVAGKVGRCHAAGFCTISCAGSCPDLGSRAPTFCVADSTDAASIATGICVSKPAAQNTLCRGLPGTVRSERDRFIGLTTAAPARATVCAPR